MVSAEIEILGNLSVDILLAFQLDAVVNQHAVLYYKGMIPQARFACLQGNSFAEDTVTALEGNESVLFVGHPLAVNLVVQNDVHYLEVTCVSYTYLLDTEYRKATYQNALDSYRRLLDDVASRADASVITTAVKEEKTGTPLFQYMETDWAFIKRLAGKVGTVVIPNYRVDIPQLCFGVPAGARWK